MEKKYDSDTFLAHLKQKWRGQACPLCGAKNWNVSDSVYELREFHGGGLVLGSGPILPVVPVTCSNCGNTILVNALLSGAVAQSKAIEEEEEEEEENGQ